MSIKTFSRCGIVLFLAILVSGCSGGRHLGNKCAWYRGGCSYEGSYELGERGYAEREAARLNERQSRRINRNW
jgi:hypothetical protein